MTEFDPVFKVICGLVLEMIISLEPVNGVVPNLQSYIFWTRQRLNLVWVNLIPTLQSGKFFMTSCLYLWLYTVNTMTLPQCNLLIKESGAVYFF